MANGKRVHALILTHLPVEARAVLFLLRPDGEWGSNGEWVSETGTIGHVCTVDGEYETVRVVVIQVESSGDATAGVLREAAEKLAPLYALLVGLATGVREVSVGTVVAANKVYAYDRGADGRSFRTHPELGAGSYRLVCRAEAEALRSRWLSRIYGGNIPERHPEARVGPIAAGSPIVESPEGAVWHLLRQSYSDALAIETAGHGFLKGAHQAKLDAIVVRGISRLLEPRGEPTDDANAEREAARNAAAFAVEILTRLPLGGDAEVTSELAQEPSYETPEQQRWAKELTEKNKERKRLAVAGEDISQIERSILELRRKLLDGPDLPPGYTLAKGRFTLIRPLGEGGFGTVWEAWDDTERSLVAVKVLHGRFGRDTNKRERFFRGARTMDRLRHEAIVGIVHRKGSEDGYHYFVMDLHRGRLREAVRLGGLGRREQASILVGVAAALGFAHENGAIHRDVKPDNIVWDFVLKPKLTDFDLVSVEGTLALTEPSAGMGSLGYSAPEILHTGREASPQSDIYSLAATALFLLDGKDPPLEEIMRDPFGLVKRSSCPEALKPVIARGLAWHPRDRYPSMGHFRAALERAFKSAEMEGDHVEGDPGAIAAREKKRHVLALTDGEVEDILAVAPPLVRSQIHPESRSTKRRLDLASMVEVIRSNETAPFLDRLDKAIRRHAAAPPIQKVAETSVTSKDADWETIFESLVRLPEDQFEEVLGRASISAGVPIADSLSSADQWSATSDLMEWRWLDARRMACVEAEIGLRLSRPSSTAHDELNAFAREALLHLKMSKALQWIQRSGDQPVAAATNTWTMDRLARMIAERRYADLDKTMDTLGDFLFASASSAAFAMLGRIHTLASEASTPEPPPDMSRSEPGWRADRMQWYRALNALPETDFRGIVARLSHPGALPSCHKARALRSMALIWFAEKWGGTGALARALDLDARSAGSCSTTRTAGPLRPAPSAELVERGFLRLPSILSEEILFGFAADNRRSSKVAALMSLLTNVGVDIVNEQITLLLSRFGEPDWNPQRYEEQWPEDKYRTAVVDLASAATDSITWVAGKAGIPEEYLSSASRPDARAAELLDWKVLKPTELRRWIDLATTGP